MKRYTDLEYLRLSKGEKFSYRFLSFFAGIPQALKNAGIGIGRFFAKIGKSIGGEFADIFTTFRDGDWKTKSSYLVMGLGSIARGQILRGLLFLLFELVFIVYMVLPQGGVYWLSKLDNLGDQGPHKEMVMQYGQSIETVVYGDNSFRILLYGVLTIFFIIAFIYTWRVNIRQNKMAEKILASGKKLKSGKEDLHSIVDDQFHKTLLALPMTGIIMFTVLPILFMNVWCFFMNFRIGLTGNYDTNLYTSFLSLGVCFLLGYALIRIGMQVHKLKKERRLHE